MFISLGMDCSLAYQLDKAGLRGLSLPFDWVCTGQITDLINILENKFESFLDISQYKITPNKSDNFLLNHPGINKNIYSKFKMKHIKYKVIVPHELAENTQTYLNQFIEKYDRRIKRFYNLENSGKKLIFIRAGTFNEIEHLDKLELILSKSFSNFKLKFINYTEFQTCSSWKKNEIDWISIFDDLIS